MNLAETPTASGKQRRARRIPSVWRCERFELDEASRSVRVGSEVLKLEPKPFEVLLELSRKSEQVISKDELIAKIWPGRILSDTVLAKCVTRVRAVLGDDDQSLVRTEYGQGYCLSLKVTRYRHPWQDATGLSDGAESEGTIPREETASPVVEGRSVEAAALWGLVLSQCTALSRYAQGCEVWSELFEFWARPREVARQLGELLRLAGTSSDREISADLLGRIAGEFELVPLTDPDLLGRTSIVVGCVWRALGRSGLAATRLQGVLAWPQLAGTEWVPEIRLLCGGALIDLARHAEAEVLLNALLIEAEARHGGRSGVVLDARLGLARIEFAKGRHRRAVAGMERLLADLERWYPARHFRAAQVRQVLANELIGAGELGYARDQLDAADRDWADCNQTPPAMALLARVARARLLLAEGRHDEARVRLERILAGFEPQLEYSDGLVFDALALRGLALLPAGNAEAACKDLREACWHRRKRYTDRHPRTRWTMNALAEGLLAAQRPTQAAEIADRALYACADRDGNTVSIELLALSATLAEAWTAMGMPDRARYLVEPLIAGPRQGERDFAVSIQMGRLRVALARALCSERQVQMAAGMFSSAAADFEQAGSAGHAAAEAAHRARRDALREVDPEKDPCLSRFAWITWG
ncbi:MAG: winged helix-turn-helix domain-containing protein [Panacagrimonas sp.]